MLFLSCICCFCVRLFIDALWSPAGKGLTSWLSFVMSYCEVVTFPLVSWVRRGDCLYRLLIFALFLTFKKPNMLQPFLYIFGGICSKSCRFELYMYVATSSLSLPSFLLLKSQTCYNHFCTFLVVSVVNHVGLSFTCTLLLHH